MRWITCISLLTIQGILFSQPVSAALSSSPFQHSSTCLVMETYHLPISSVWKQFDPAWGTNQTLFLSPCDIAAPPAPLDDDCRQVAQPSKGYLGLWGPHGLNCHQMFNTMSAPWNDSSSSIGGDNRATGLSVISSWRSNVHFAADSSATSPFTLTANFTMPQITAQVIITCDLNASQTSLEPNGVITVTQPSFELFTIPLKTAICAGARCLLHTGSFHFGAAVYVSALKPKVNYTWFVSPCQKSVLTGTSKAQASSCGTTAGYFGQYTPGQGGDCVLMLDTVVQPWSYLIPEVARRPYSEVVQRAVVKRQSITSTSPNLLAQWGSSTSNTTALIIVDCDPSGTEVWKQIGPPSLEDADGSPMWVIQGVSNGCHALTQAPGTAAPTTPSPPETVSPPTPAPQTPQPTVDCGAYTDCFYCTGAGPCGFCASTKTCLNGGPNGPNGPPGTCPPEDWEWARDDCG